MMFNTSTFLLLCFVLVLGFAKTNASGPVDVYILAGQSNMVGMGSVTHLKMLLNDTDTQAEYQHLVDGNNWTIRDNVFIKFDERTGPLTVGYGGSAGGTLFGPELEFGNLMGDVSPNQTTFLIKTAYGGKSLGVDFRSPSSGLGNYSAKPLDFGRYYRAMVEDILQTLKDIATYVPGYNVTEGYRVRGFVWFQGWNDVIDGKKVAEYESNLANLIRDVRADIEVPDMPTIVGELGQAGLIPQGRGADRHMAMRKSELDVTLLEEFLYTTLYVRTSPYVVANGTTFNGNYHYYGRADTYCHIGRAFGKGMMALQIKSKQKTHSPTKEHGRTQTPSFLRPLWDLVPKVY